LKKTSEKVCRLLGQHSLLNPQSMIQTPEARQVHARAASPELRFPRAENHTLDTRLVEGTHTHHTGLDRYEHLRAVEPPRSPGLAGSRERQDLRMRRRIPQRFDPIVPATDDPSIDNNHTANRNFALVIGASRFVQSQTHPVLVLVPLG
jgi:hypothetical protein